MRTWHWIKFTSLRIVKKLFAREFKCQKSKPKDLPTNDFAHIYLSFKFFELTISFQAILFDFFLCLFFGLLQTTLFAFGCQNKNKNRLAFSKIKHQLIFPSFVHILHVFFFIASKQTKLDWIRRSTWIMHKFLDFKDSQQKNKNNVKTFQSLFHWSMQNAFICDA